MFRVELTTSGVEAYVDQYFDGVTRDLEGALLRATQQGARRLKNSIRQAMAGAGLGRLGKAFGDTSDLAKGGIQRRYSNGGFSASGTVYVRSKSDRTLGAIQSYVEGSTIAPVRGRWLWIPTDAMQRVAGQGKNKRRLTPGNWAELGMEAKLGPLRYLKSVNGWPLAAVENVGVSATGAARSARSLTKRGMARKGQVRKELLVCFVAIPRTSRAARIDIQALLNQVAGELPALIRNEIGKV